MTQEEFLVDLQKYSPLVQWNLYRKGELRTLNGQHCPVTWVAKKKKKSKFKAMQPFAAGELIGLDDCDIEEIAAAADKCDPYSLSIRAKLIEITKPLQTVDA